MSKLTVWIADRMTKLGDALIARADEMYTHDIIISNYNFDDDETERTSDAASDFRILLPDGDGPDYEADNGDEEQTEDGDGR